MIPRTPPACQNKKDRKEKSRDDIDLLKTTSQLKEFRTSHWQNLLARAIRDPAELIEYLELPESFLAGAILANKIFPLRVPQGYLQRIKKGDPDDPLLRQILPYRSELKQDALFLKDPVGDIAAAVVPGLLHKYHGRVLLITTAACAIHCRYCFRRHFPYRENRSSPDWQQAINYIRDHDNIHEVILSGGDPLSLTESHLKTLTDQLIKLPHIKTLRLHTRLPIVLPERVDEPLLSWFDSLPWKIVVVLHCNHANEIDEAVSQALQQLHKHHITLLNQSVLLAGVNNNPDALIDLSHKLFSNHVLPYYLHRLDKVEGATHFEISTKESLKLHTTIREQLPGYLVPRLVEEIAGELSKTPVADI